MAVLIEGASAPAGTYEQILALLRTFTASAARPSDAADYVVQLREEDGGLIGGLWAQSLFGGFHIDMIVVDEGHRGLGFGRSLMDAAEAEARRRHCHMMWLDTFEFQARPFYERLGFTVSGTLEGPPPIYPRYIMSKALS